MREKNRHEVVRYVNASYRDRVYGLGKCIVTALKVGIQEYYFRDISRYYSAR